MRTFVIAFWQIGVASVRFKHMTSTFLQRFQGRIVSLAIAAMFVVGCAGPGPKMFPPAPVEVRERGKGSVERIYDLTGDGKTDFSEVLTEGRVRVLRYRLDSTANVDVDENSSLSDGDVVVLDRIAASDCRRLLIILDSVPYSMALDLWNSGRFRYFNPPSRSIAPFPVMTDLALVEFFHCAPAVGVESAFYDGKKLTNGYSAYAGEANTPWLPFVDYRMNPMAHTFAYLYPNGWFGRELRGIEELFLREKKQRVVGYSVGTSALGAKFGRNGHLQGLIRVDRMCQYLYYKTRGRIQITLMSDHGHNLMRSTRIPLPAVLEQSGYRVGECLKKPGDVIVPEFGVVTCAAIYTHEAATVARDVANVDGVDFTAYVDSSDRVVVVNRRGTATITRREGAYYYDASSGDPLALAPVIEGLKKKSAIKDDGFIEDHVLLEATLNHTYPDGVHRLWRAFHGLIKNMPEVLVSVEDGWHCGSPFMTKVIDLSAAHGNLKMLSSSGFAMTTAGPLPPVVRMEDLHAAMEKAGAVIGEPQKVSH